MNHFSKTLTAVAAGLAAGATLGSLFAPEKGSDIRKKIMAACKKKNARNNNTFGNTKVTKQEPA
ncbi:YtxH domain-containing protein [Niabella drilacis]|uniref:YtxH-like protein n=1 Tax=Niabella drilacis (strain DSM 25811 / CCM 8410 / CCUG 62505 / LMG 26954 / E90) TaxID=1285928 RepID=A0A1G6RFW0_NIADE|nr:YtxH domain-containing protein [Niabella drilacis]SDD02885.1 YtxH-like protein [Niabella drilacis]